MPLNGAYSWKDDDLSPEERIDHFFNLIDHAVENGVPLTELYSREHVKTFLCYVLRRAGESRKRTPTYFNEDHHMPRLNLTSTFASAIIVGEPGILVITLPPKENLSVNVTDVQLRQLTAQLEKLKAANWLDYSVADQNDKATKVVAKPEAVKVVEELKVTAAHVEPEPTPEPEPEPAPATEPVVAKEEEEEEKTPAPAPSAPKPQIPERKYRR
jgi:hypothetical protein